MQNETESVEETVSQTMSRFDLNLSIIADRVNTILFWGIPFLAVLVFAGFTEYFSVGLFAGLSILFIGTRFICAYVSMRILREEIGVEFNMLYQMGLFVISTVIVGSIAGVIYHFSPLGDLIAMSIAVVVLVVGVARSIKYSVEVNDEDVYFCAGG